MWLPCPVLCGVMSPQKMTYFGPAPGLVLNFRNVTGSITAFCISGTSWSIVGACGDVTSEQQWGPARRIEIRLFCGQGACSCPAVHLLWATFGPDCLCKRSFPASAQMEAAP